MPRPRLLAIVLLSASLQVVGMARSTLPAQDGLKFLRVARAFQNGPWLDAIRGSDQHPLYPACVAAVQPVVSVASGSGPLSWRLAGQIVSATAAILTLFPLFVFTRNLFADREALLSCLLFALLPSTSGIGHETLSDGLSLFFFTTALALGERTWRLGLPRDAIGAGLAAGLGYWTRPEAAVVALAIGVPLSLGAIRRHGTQPAIALGVAFLAMVGAYAVTKGEVSEKLALRQVAGLNSAHPLSRKGPHWLPPGLDDPRLDFSPKEESAVPRPIGPIRSTARVVEVWTEGMGWFLAPVVLWGILHTRSDNGRGIPLTYAILFTAVLVRHSAGLGYLSERHTLTLVIAALPWASSGLIDVSRITAKALRLNAANLPRRRRIALALLLLAGVFVALKPSHESRDGHRQAAYWLASHAEPGQAVLDTRGWAAFLSGLPSYDPWHVRQAFTDSHLAFLVIGSDELRANSARGRTWRAVLSRAGEPAASFSTGRSDDVLVYRFQRPASWEGLAR